MILKYFELKKKNFSENKFFLLYGNNTGLVEETLETKIKPLSPKNVFTYEENEIIKNTENFEENLLNKSFFENEKLIIIRRASDKILNIIRNIIEKKLNDIYFVLISNTLEKKSKLRNYFEKETETVCIPFYEDNYQSLNYLIQNFLRQKKILLSQENINLIIERCRGDRINLKNELEKIENFSKTKNKISTDDIIKLTNLSENFSLNELVDNALAKNKKKILNILNENNFAAEDSILITKIIINKLKRLLQIQNDMKIHKNLDKAMSNYKPQIFWKEKDIVKKQIKFWDLKAIENLIFETNDIELIIKKNPSVSNNIVTNFLLNQSN